MKLQDCLEEADLAELANALVLPDAQEAYHRHLAGCAACRARLAQAVRAIQDHEESETGSGRLRTSLLRFSVWKVAAAALILGTGAVFHATRSGCRTESVVLPGVRVAGISEVLENTGSSDVSFRLPDGTLLRLHPGASARFHFPSEGERINLELRSGRLEAEVAKGRGTFRIRSAAGEIRVLGTRFRAAAYRVRFVDPDFSSRELKRRPIDCLSVGVIEGKVALRNAQGHIEVSGGGRGIVLVDRPPSLMESAGTRANLLAKFVALLEPAEKGWRIGIDRHSQAELLAAMFWSGEWPGTPQSGDAEEQAALELFHRMRAP